MNFLKKEFIHSEFLKILGNLYLARNHSLQILVRNIGYFHPKVNSCWVFKLSHISYRRIFRIGMMPNSLSSVFCSEFSGLQYPRTRWYTLEALAPRFVDSHC